MRIAISFLSLLLAPVLWAQDLQNGFAANNQQRRAPAHSYVRQADVLWSKTLWRQIDLDERKNQHLYYPETNTGTYKNLVHVLVDLVERHGVSLYEETAGDEFGLPLTASDLHTNLGASQSTIAVDEPVQGSRHQVVVNQPFDPTEIRRLLVKELWFFDRNTSQMQVRILGLCPVRVYYRPEDTDRENPLFRKVGWFYYPEIEKLLTHYPAMYGHNPAWGWSYYDVFAHRYFSSHVVQESNPYNNRPISDYAQGTDALLEGRRIEEGIRDLESDFWNN